MRLRTALVLAAGAMLLAACGDAATNDSAAPPPAAGMCHVDTPDCVDTHVDEDGDVDADDAWGDEFDSEAAREEARAQIGLAEDELDPDIRVGRRGPEQFALTEDYVLGRITVELDEDDGGTYRVVAATVELPEGPETFT